MAYVKSGWTFCLVLFGVFVTLALPAMPFSGQATKIIKFMPDTPGRGVREGKCWTRSIAIPRPDAWRCMIGNEIVDPCFASADKKYAVCNPNPARGEPGFRLKLTEPLPRSDVPAQSMTSEYKSGWLVELADGNICRPMTGTSFEVQGKTANFYCENGQKGEEVVLLDGLNAGKPLWTAKKATVVFSRGSEAPKLLKSEKIAVKTVWQ
ncbi:MAG: hypothetical protein ABSF90_15525 [Syntrophobacteraceae bacterium]|jgi:hypothetical protein